MSSNVIKALNEVWMPQIAAFDIRKNANDDLCVVLNLMGADYWSNPIGHPGTLTQIDRAASNAVDAAAARAKGATQ